MGGRKGTKLFISYARKDAADLAQRLRRDLAAKGIDAWLDTRRLEPGSTWSFEIERAIDTCEAMLVLTTAGSYASDICRGEQLRAGRRGKRLIPILAQAGSDRPVYLEAKQYLDFSSDSFYNQRFQELLATIEGGGGGPLDEKYRTTPITYVTAPPTVVNYVDRPEALAALREALFAEHSRGPLALTALAGMGGIGKTVLAHALTRDTVVQDAFPDGIVWITIGREQTSDLLASFREIGKALDDDLQRCETLPGAINQYKTALAQKAALIVVDDIWKTSDLEPFLADSERSRLLFTTRDASVARFIGAQEHTADLFSLEQARDLLAAWAGLEGKARPAQVDPSIDAVIEECGNLPLALSIVGAILRGAPAEEWEDTLQLLRRADLSGIADRLPPGQESFFRSVEVSFKALAPEMRERYEALAVLSEDMAAPLPILRTLWGVSEPEARRVSRHFFDRSLAQRDDEIGSIRLHDLQLDYVRAHYPDRKALDVIHGAMRLSSHLFDKDPTQFASQMLGRLLPHQELPTVGQFTESVRKGAPRPWLRPLLGSLTPPGGPLLRTLSGHTNSVNAVVVTPDGKQVVSASHDRTLKVRELQTGRELRTLVGHSDRVNAVAVTPDGKQAVSACGDNTLKVWDLETGRELRTLSGHIRSVSGVAVMPNGKRAVSASWDNTLKVWDLGTGRQVRSLSGHTNWVTAVALTPDGKHAISASEDNTLKVWDLSTGQELRTLFGHTNWVSAVVVTPDGTQAVSGSEDHTLKLWELATGRELRTFSGHTNWVRAVAVTPDGKQALSASRDRTLKVWDLRTGRELLTLTGRHPDSVSAVTVTPDGKQAVSASLDGTLKVWNLAPDPECRTPSGHTQGVTGIAVTPDGKQAISTSEDSTLKVWDLASGKELCTLTGHTGMVTAMAVTPDGKEAVSASWDSTLKLWDLATGRELRTLTGHTNWVSAVVVVPDGKQAVSASSDQTLKVWDLATGRELRSLMGHTNGISTVTTTSDGKRAVSGSWDNTLKVWDLAKGRELRTLTGHLDWVTAVEVMPDGKQAVSASEDNTLKVWDLATGRELRTLSGHIGKVSALAMTPDGKQAVSASVDSTLKVWDLATGREVRTLLGHSSSVMTVAVTPDGKHAVSGSFDNTLKVWDLETGVLLATFGCEYAADCCVFAGARTIVAGDASGRVHFLSLELDENC